MHLEPQKTPPVSPWKKNMLWNENVADWKWKYEFHFLPLTQYDIMEYLIFWLVSQKTSQWIP